MILGGGVVLESNHLPTPTHSQLNTSILAFEYRVLKIFLLLKQGLGQLNQILRLQPVCWVLGLTKQVHHSHSETLTNMSETILRHSDIPTNVLAT